ncbi:DUF5060 domain-containing protein [Streptomyces sp. FXJ1.4098]|nr:DUF5060 domain-containing protein [Streptomyces sp. FXJ1.4098]
MTARRVERWDVYELRLTGPQAGNPYQDVTFGADFRHRHRVVPVEGFYDGQGVYRVRFMPDRTGPWTYTTRSDAAELDGHSGELTCVAAGPGNHGPVRVSGPRRFRYADGTPYEPFGTTCYHWTHDEDEELEELTLSTLAASPFNKVRMCLLPTRAMNPPRLPFPAAPPARWTQPASTPPSSPTSSGAYATCATWASRRTSSSSTPTTRGTGRRHMTREEDFSLVRHALARLAAYRNVWWSIANEYDFNTAKTTEDWDRIGQYVQRHDPYQHPRSIHNGTRMYEYERIYDFTKPWTTHQSIQHWDAAQTSRWLASCPKPVVLDEIGYEGKLGRRWGNLTGRALVRQFWHGVSAGGYVGHGECYPEQDPDHAAWISRGGRLHGDSPPRIAFLRRLREEGPEDTYVYFGDRRHAHRDIDLPDTGAPWRLDLVDTWEMTVTPLPGVHRGRVRVPLDRRPDLALRLRREI